jgi:hypothetical protein
VEQVELTRKDQREKIGSRIGLVWEDDEGWFWMTSGEDMDKAATHRVCLYRPDGKYSGEIRPIGPDEELFGRYHWEAKLSV